MQIKICHRDVIASHADDDEPGVSFVHVANFEAPEGDVLDALEAAWVASQNIAGSWSRGPVFEDGSANADYRAAIEVIAPLPEHDGKVYGHRSSSVGDLFGVGERRFRVASCGFEEEGVLKRFEVFLLSESGEAALVWSGEALNRYKAKALARAAANCGELAHLHAVVA